MSARRDQEIGLVRHAAAVAHAGRVAGRALWSAAGAPALAFALLALAGCGQQRRPVIPHAAFTMTGAHQEAVEGDDTTSVRLEWPEFVGARTPEALDSLRLAVNTLLLAPAGGRETPAPSTDSLMLQFIEGWNQLRRETRTTEYWQLERRVAVVAETLGVVSLSFAETSFTGGAHPSSTMHLLNLDADRGRALRFEDFFRPELRDSLDRALEPMFRMTRNVPPDSSLKAAGFWFPDDRFHVNDDFAVTGGGMLWHFDPYEIAPYSMGPTDFVVPFSALAPFANPEGPLGVLR